MKERKRLVIVACGLFALFSLLIAQFFKIQILEQEKWTHFALAQHEFLLKEPCKRGAFFACTSIRPGQQEKPQPLVFDVTKYHLFIDPVAIPEIYRDEIASHLSQFLVFEGSIRKEFDLKSRSRRLALWIDLESKNRIMQWWLPFAKQKKIASNALFFVTDYQRSYPFGKLLGQVLHTIREMKDEATGEGLPTGGLEAYFNALLKGKSGKRKMLRSPLNQLEIDKVIESPEDGADVYLTINHCIQAIVEEELEKGVIAAQAKGGWAVMIDPLTGEIWALAQYPFFEPTNYRDYFNDPNKIEDTKVKALTDAFELGSIMKPITLSIGLKANEELAKAGKPPLFNPNDPLDVTRSIFPGRASRPLKDLPPCKAMNLEMALQKSSNVYMAQVVDRVVSQMGSQWYHDALINLFGFETKTQLELPAEAIGMVPQPGKCYPNGVLQWSLPTPYSLSIGYNLLATSLQMVRAYAVFASGGYLPKLTLVKKIMKNDQVIYDGAERPPFPKVLSDEIVETVVRGMKFSTKPGGTGRLADVSGYTEAGKTGTAEKIVKGAYSKQKYISSFVGFAPAQLEKSGTKTRFVLIVTLDEPEPIRLEGGLKNYVGGRCAAPVFREIVSRTLEYLGVAPDDPFGYPPGDPRYNPEKADWIPEVKQLQALYEKWNLKER